MAGTQLALRAGVRAHHCLWVAIATLVAAQSSVAHADPSPPDTTSRALVLRAELPFPGNGAITVYSQPGEPKVFTVASAATPAVAIEGTVASYSLHFAWTASSPLAPGQYLVTTQTVDTAPITEQVITVVAASERDKPALSVLAVQLKEYATLASGICCTGYSSVADTTCFPDTTRRHVGIAFGLDSAAPAEDINQFMFRIYDAAMPPSPTDNFYTPITPIASLEVLFTTEADEYCFGIDAIDLGTQAVHTYPELSDNCKPHGSLGPLGWEPIDVADGALDRIACPSPPEALHDAWCEHNEAACDGLPPSESDGNGCFFYDWSCDGGPWPGLIAPPLDVDAGQVAPPTHEAGSDGGMTVPEGTAGASGTSSSGAAGTMDQAPPESATDTERSQSSGCSCRALTPSRTPAAGAWAALGILSAVAIGRSRSRKRARPALSCADGDGTRVEGAGQARLVAYRGRDRGVVDRTGRVQR